MQEDNDPDLSLHNGRRAGPITHESVASNNATAQSPPFRNNRRTIEVPLETPATMAGRSRDWITGSGHRAHWLDEIVSLSGSPCETWKAAVAMTADKFESHPPTSNGHAAPDSKGEARVAQPTDRQIAARSRMGSLWVSAVAFAFVLLLLMIFVLQNGQSAEVSFLGAHGHLPMGVALLLAAIFGVLLVALPGTTRILQLRTRGGRRRAAVAETSDRPSPAPHASNPPTSTPGQTG